MLLDNVNEYSNHDLTGTKNAENKMITEFKMNPLVKNTAIIPAPNPPSSNNKVNQSDPKKIIGENKIEIIPAQIPFFLDCREYLKTK